MAKSHLTAHRLKELLDYDPATGAFVWKPRAEPWFKEAGKVAGSFEKKGYRSIKIDGRSYKAHRLAFLFVFGRWPTNQLDHRDENKANNAISNLGECSTSENCQRQQVRRNNTSGFQGVSWNIRQRQWIARIMVNMRSIHLGYFDSPLEAAAVYVEAKRIHHVYSPETPIKPN